jgi:cell wall-associated NlpC family hydrolase
MRLSKLAAVCILALLACLGAAQQTKKVVLGKLGQALESTSIKASPRSSSRTYYKVKPYEYLVVQASSAKGWKKVLLENGIWGYVKSDVVASLPYDVEYDAPVNARPGSVPSPSRGGLYVAQRGVEFHGVRYKWGGTDPRTGIDCSAFVKMLYGEIGVSLPRTAAEQAMVGQKITRLEDLRAGDRLYFWSKSRNKIGHTGVYLGNGYFVHSSSGKGQVSTDYLGSPKWMKTLVAARRSA